MGGRKNWTLFLRRNGHVESKEQQANGPVALVGGVRKLARGDRLKNKYSAVTLKKQKQELSKRLRAFFRIEDDPIEWIKETKTYRCKFRILPEGDEVY